MKEAEYKTIKEAKQLRKLMATADEQCEAL